LCQQGDFLLYFFMPSKRFLPPIITEMDTVSEMIFSYIILRAEEEDMEYDRFLLHGNKRIPYRLQRGQCIFNSQIFKQNGIPRGHISYTLKMLSNRNDYLKITFVKKTYGFIATVANLDEFLIK